MTALSGGFAALSGNLRGAIWMVLGGTALTLLAVVIRHLQDTYSVLEMIFMRSAVSFLLILLNQRSGTHHVCVQNNSELA